MGLFHFHSDTFHFSIVLCSASECFPLKLGSYRFTALTEQSKDALQCHFEGALNKLPIVKYKISGSVYHLCALDVMWTWIFSLSCRIYHSELGCGSRMMRYSQPHTLPITSPLQKFTTLSNFSRILQLQTLPLVVLFLNIKWPDGHAAMHTLSPPPYRVRLKPPVSWATSKIYKIIANFTHRHSPKLQTVQIQL